MAAIVAAYAECQRRDDSAERQRWQWQRMALLLGLWGVVGWSLFTWHWARRQQVQAFVQVVVEDDQGRVVQQALPQDLLAYTPQEAQWMQMVGTWVRQVRWRGTDPVLMRAHWASAYRHTCGQARRLLEDVEKREKPFAEGNKRLVTVELKSITKTPVPEAYQVLWTETATAPDQPAVKTQLWTGTFSVGRYRPADMATMLENRLGLCVLGFDFSQTP
jgi:type IV secretory pathway TrbF-like protein